MLQAKAGYDIQHNDKEGHKLAGKLESKGAFRTQLPEGRDRQDKPKWSGEVHEISDVSGTTVTDTDGKKYQSKLVLPVPSGSASVRYEPDTNVKRFLRPHGDALQDAVSRGPVSLRSLQTAMQKNQNFSKALKDSKKSFSEFAGMFGDVNDGQVTRREWTSPPEPDEEQRARFAYGKANPQGLMETYKSKLAIPAGGMTLADARKMLDREPSFGEDLGVTGRTFRDFLQSSSFRVKGNKVFS